MADFSSTGEVRLNSDPAEKITSKWTVAAGNMIADFAKKASAELGKVVKSGIDYNASMESYLTNFKVMLGNEELAAEKLSELRKIAASTPFALSDLTEGTQTLLQFGIAADDTTGVLKQLGDISLGNADKLQTLVRAYGKMSSAKKVTLENVNMMIDAGFNPLNQICEATGESMSDLYKRISDGKVSFSELQAAVSAATSEGGQFYNGMLEASQTFSGRMSTLKDNVSALTGELTSGLFAALGELVVKLNEVVTSFLDSDEKMAQLKDTIGIAASVVAAAGAAFLTYKGYVALATAAEIAHTAYTTAMTAAHAAAEAGTTGLALAQAALNAVISANPVGLFVAALAALATGLVTAYQTSETFRNAVNSAFTAVEKIAQNAIGTVVDWLNELVAKIRGAAAALANLKNGVSAAQEAYDAAYNGYMDDYNQSKRDKAAAKRKALHDERVKQAQEEKAAAEAAAAASTNATGIITNNAGKAAKATKQATATVVKSISDTTTTVKDGVTRTVETVNETLSNGKKQQKQVITETSQQVVNGVRKDVKTVTEIAADGSRTVKQTMEDVKASVQTTVKDTQTSIVDGAQVTVEKTTETLTDGSERVSTVTTRTGTEVIEGVERTVKTVTTKTADGVETTVKTIEDAGPQYASAGELLTTQLRTKLEDGWKSIKKDIQTDAVGAIKTLANALKNGDLEQLGFWAASYFWQACTDKQREQITAIAQGALDQLGNALSGVGNKLAALASSLVAKFVPAATTATGAQEGLNVAMDANPILLVISLIGMLVGALLNFASTNKNVANGMNDVWSGVADFMSYIFEGLMYVLGLFVEQFVIEINALIGAYNLVAQLWVGQIDYVSNPAWDYAKKIQKEREDRKNARLAKQEQAELDAGYARQSGDAEKKQLDAEYAKKAAELARAKLTEDDPGMLDAEKAVAAADYKKSVADLEKKLLDAEYKKQSAQIGKKTAADATALADLEKQLVEAENTLRMGDLERELLQLDYEKTLRDLEEKYKPGTPAKPEKPDASTDPGTPGTTPDKDNTDAIRDNTEALLAANSKLAEMVRQADSLVLSDNMAISRSVAASGTAKVAAAANQYHREGDTNITQNIYSKAQTAADLQREARWEADRAKAQKR